MTANSFFNEYPIILVHGFCGWGREEMGGFKYWGGINDIEAKLNDLHYRTYTATVGPVSSNRERTVELYHYIVGGTVDYGAAHAKKYGIKRFGHTYHGIYPSVSDENKIHLVGHSMGGHSIRQLENFLRDGSKEEQDYYKENPDEGISELFLGGKKWIHSLTCVAPAHNGSSALEFTDMVEITKKLILEFAAFAGLNLNESIYNFKLEQWGIKKEMGEFFLDYADRIIKSDIWTTKNNAWYDISIEGSELMNKNTKTYKDTYYFSHPCDTTLLNPLTGHHLPLIGTNPLFIGFAYEMGKYTDKDNATPIGSEWWPSDGCVPVISAQYPFGHPNREASDTDIEFKPGIWNYFPAKHGWDHMDIVGVHSKLRMMHDVIPFYKELASRMVDTEKAVPKKKEHKEHTEEKATKEVHEKVTSKAKHKTVKK